MFFKTGFSGKVIFDCDDTLGDTIELFYNADRIYLSLIDGKIRYHSLLSDDAVRFKSFEDSVISDMRNYDAHEIRSTGKYSRENYKRAIYNLFFDEASDFNFKIMKDDFEILDEVVDTGFSADLIRKEAMENTFKMLAKEGFDIYVYTKGEDLLQRDKVRNLGLFDFVGDKKIVVVEEKSSEAFGYFFTSDDIMIGNSLASDILPAVENSAVGIYLPKKTWTLEESKEGLEKILSDGHRILVSEKKGNFDVYGLVHEITDKQNYKLIVNSFR